MTDPRSANEVAVARPLVEFLRVLEWDVHQEVEAPTGRIDVVAVHGAIVHAIEVKVSLTFAVLSQALSHRRHAHFISVAVPPAKTAHGRQERRFAYSVAKQYGVGVYEVREPSECVGTYSAVLRHPYMLLRVFGDYVPPVHQIVRPTLLRRPSSSRILERLCEETRTYAEAGNADGRYWSPFKATCAAIVEAVKAGPLTTRELVKKIEHHYASDAGARTTLPKWLAAGKIPGVRPADGIGPLRWELDKPSAR